MKSALFVDFDNVYSGLRKMDTTFADRFARQPLDWLNWLAGSLELPEHSPAGARRRLLVRRCYLNPAIYQKFRPSFNRAGFEIVDCPPMTSEGKTSTDIHMVLDIVDLLQHEAHYDEFIVFSADADFTPVLRKLRRWDRRTTVLAIGFPSAAYQASADLLIDPDAFVSDALGFADVEEPVTPTASVLAPAADMPAVAEKIAEMKASPSQLKAQVGEFIKDVVASSKGAVSLPKVAQQLPARIPELVGSKWCGSLSFRALIDSLPLAPLAVSWRGGGSVWDPRRHTSWALGNGVAVGDDWGSDNDFAAAARQTHEATGQPLLTPHEYAVLFNAIADDLAAHQFQLAETGKRVRDRCRASGEAISRADVNFVLQGLLFSGHEFGKGQDTPALLARHCADNALGLCRREQLVLDDSMIRIINRWIAGDTSREVQLNNSP
jgi:hypothetical protein